jgi:hypothetical protein
MEPDRPPTARPSPARGVVLIAVAVVLGLFLLRAIDNDDATSATDAAEVETADETTSPGDGDENEEEGADDDGGGDENDGDDDSPAPAPRPPEEITVIVLNASGVQGAAAEQTDRIAFAGYQTATAGNAPQQLTDSQVQHAEGHEAEARALAEAIGAPADATSAISPELADVDLQGSQLVVLLGTDLAGG